MFEFRINPVDKKIHIFDTKKDDYRCGSIKSEFKDKLDKIRTTPDEILTRLYCAAVQDKPIEERNFDHNFCGLCVSTLYYRDTETY